MSEGPPGFKPLDEQAEDARKSETNGKQPAVDEEGAKDEEPQAESTESVAEDESAEAAEDEEASADETEADDAEVDEPVEEAKADEPADEPQPVAEPPQPPLGHTDDRVGVFESIRWHWLTFLIPVVLFTGAGIAAGTAREPTHTAEARAEVRIHAISPNAIAGTISASENLASAYARELRATPVVEAISERSGLPATLVNSRVSASPIADSPVITLKAKGPSGAGAIRLANISSSELRSYIDRLAQRPGDEANEVNREARAAIEEYQRRLETQQQLEGRTNAEEDPSDGLVAALRQARVRTQMAAFRRDALRQSFAQTLVSYRAPLEPMTRAASASSDRNAKLQLFAAGGLIIGLLVGTALATFRANRGHGFSTAS